MTSPEEGIQSQLRNIERDYGQPIAELVKAVADSGLTKHQEIVAMLKTRFGMTHGAAHRVSLTARDRLGLGVTSVPPTEGPALTQLLLAVRALGPVEEAPKKGYVSLRRRKQFAMLQPTARLLNVGLILPGVEPSGRLERAGSWNPLFTHRVRVATLEEVDDELLGWLRQAYDRAG